MSNAAPKARRPYPWLPVAALFLAVSALLAWVVDGARPPATASAVGLPWLDSWFGFDSGWYYGIVRHGYFYRPGQQSSIAFFPTFPLLVRALSAPTGQVQVTGQVLSVALGLLTVTSVGAWAWHRLPRSSGLLACGVLLTYPYTLFLHGPMYADGLFVVLALGALVLTERRRYLLAGLVGALAVATRPFGIAVTAGLAVLALEQVAVDRRSGERPVGDRSPVGWRDVVTAVRHARWRPYLVLVSGLGLVGWMVYLAVAFGDPLAFVRSESAPGWDQGVGPHTWFKVAFFSQIWHGHWRMVVDLGLQALACLLVVLLLPRVQRLFGWGYAAYTAVVIAIPILGTKDFMGAGRYALAAFPALAAAGDWLAARPRWLQLAVLGLMLAVMVELSWSFANGKEVS